MHKTREMYATVHCYDEDVLDAIECPALPPPAESKRFAAFDVVVVASSAGGIPALVPFLAGLPDCFSAPVVVAQHLPPAFIFASCLQRVLQRRSVLRVKWAEDGEAPLAGTVYVAPQDKITYLNDSRCLSTQRISHVPGRTPWADSLFRSAAASFGRRALGVVLSGALSDGADGCLRIAQAGGTVLVQSSASSQFPDMPRAAFERCRIGLAFDPSVLAHIAVALVMAPGTADWFRVGTKRPFEPTFSSRN